MLSVSSLPGLVSSARAYWNAVIPVSPVLVGIGSLPSSFVPASASWAVGNNARVTPPTGASGSESSSALPITAPTPIVCIVIRNGKLNVASPPASTMTTSDSPTNSTPAAMSAAATMSLLAGSSTWYDPATRASPVVNVPSALIAISIGGSFKLGPRTITFAWVSSPATIASSSKPCATSGASASTIVGSPAVCILSCNTSSMNSTPEIEAVRVCVPSKFRIADSESPSATVCDTVSKLYAFASGFSMLTT